MLNYSRWKSYPVKFSKQLVPRLGAEAVMLGLSVVDADIKGFFENVDHEWLMKFLGKIIQDKTFLRYIKRFLKSRSNEGNESI